MPVVQRDWEHLRRNLGLTCPQSQAQLCCTSIFGGEMLLSAPSTILVTPLYRTVSIVYFFYRELYFI